MAATATRALSACTPGEIRVATNASGKIDFNGFIENRKIGNFSWYYQRHVEAGQSVLVITASLQTTQQLYSALSFFVESADVI